MSVASIDYTPHVHQRRVHKSTANTRVIVAGRQSGKTVSAVAELAVWAMSAPERWPDEPNPQFWWTTASYKTKGKAWRDLIHHLPKGIIQKESEREAEIVLRNGSKISMRSADAPGSLVSERLHGLVADECGQYPSNIYDQLLGPMLATTGGPTILMGTPRGHNWFYEKYQNKRKGVPGWDSFHWRTEDSPYVTKQWLAERRIETPERTWQQEYLAEFLTDGGEVFRNVDTAIRPAAQPDGLTVIGLDLARTHDWTALMAFNSQGQHVAHRKVGHLDWSVQRIAVLEMYKRLNANKIVLDATGIQLGAEAVVYDLQREGLTVESVHITPEIKRALIESLMMRFDMGSISIPIEVAEEFREYSVEQLDSGYDRYGAPEGKHDDFVMAAALGMWGLRHIPPQPPVPKQLSIVERELAALGYGPNGLVEPTPKNGWEV